MNRFMARELHVGTCYMKTQPKSDSAVQAHADQLPKTLRRQTYSDVLRVSVEALEKFFTYLDGALVQFQPCALF